MKTGDLIKYKLPQSGVFDWRMGLVVEVDTLYGGTTMVRVLGVGKDASPRWAYRADCKARQ